MKEISIGVDLGGTNLRIGAYTSNGEQLKLVALPTNATAGPIATVDRMCAAIRSLHDEFSSVGRFSGVGVGSPGPLSLPEGILHNPPNLPGWDGFELRRKIARRLPWEVFVDSDANAAALAEYRIGVGAMYGVDSLCLITLGTGVGGGLIVAGQVWRGLEGGAGEIGHGPLMLTGPACNCGSRGCLELYASATGIVRSAHDLSLNASPEPGAERVSFQLTAASIAQMAFAGDERACSIFQKAGLALGLGLANLVNTLDLPIYAIGGGVSKAWDLFAPQMFTTLQDFSYVYRMSQPKNPLRYEQGKTHVCRAQLGSDAGLIGAAMLPFAAVKE